MVQLARNPPPRYMLKNTILGRATAQQVPKVMATICYCIPNACSMAEWMHKMYRMMKYTQRLGDMSTKPCKTAGSFVNAK